MNCKTVSESWKETVHYQRLGDVLNHGHLHRNHLNEQRLEHLLSLVMGHQQNQQDLLGDYLLFSIDPSDFKKYPNTQMQGVQYTCDANGGYKAQTFVMSSLIYGQSCVPFKNILYWGKKGVPKGRQLSKNRIQGKLATKAEQGDSYGAQRLAVFDAAGCHRTVWPYFPKSPEWQGGVCNFPRTRNIRGAGKTTHIRTYLANLTQQDFVRGKVAGKEGWYHVLTAAVPSLSFLGTGRLVVIQDDPDKLNQQTFRVLSPDVMDLSSEQILLIYLRRWKQETSPHIIKDRLGVRSYKHRQLKAVMRLLE